MGSFNLVRITSPTSVPLLDPFASFVIMLFSSLHAPLVALGAFAVGVLAVPAVSDAAHDRKWISFCLTAGYPLME